MSDVNAPTPGDGNVLAWNNTNSAWEATTDSQGVSSVATSGAITGGTITGTGTISHSTADGDLHVPATGTTNNGKVLTAGGTAGAMTWETPSAGGGEANEFSFKNIALTSSGTGTTSGSTVVADTTTDTVTLEAGDNVTLTGTGNTVKIEAAALGGGSGASVETVVIKYSSGGAGNLGEVDAIVSTSAGITATVIDGANSIVQFSFPGFNLPPASVVSYGQSYASNQWITRGLSSLTAASVAITDTGSAATPDILNFAIQTPPMSIQLRMADTGSSAGFGQRAQAMIRFTLLG